MVALEGILRERLSIPNAVIFRRSTMRRTIRYQVMDSKNKSTSTMATQLVQQLQLPILNTTGQAAMPGGLGPIGKVRERAVEFRGGVPGGLGRGSLEFFPLVGLS